jgi:hypothetical protein
MVFHHFLIFDLLGGKKIQSYNPKSVARSMAHIWLDGMTGGNANHQRKKSAAKKEPTHVH